MSDAGGRLRPASATTTTSNSSPLAAWIVRSRTASEPSSSETASDSFAPTVSCPSTNRTKPSISAPLSSSYDRASRASLRRFAYRRRPSARASTARS